MQSGRYSLSGDTAVVTGALGNLGPVWIEALLDAGGRVLGLDLRDAPLPAGLSSLQSRYPGRLRVRKADIRDTAQLQAALEECIERLGPPSVLVNNAGIDQPPSPALKTYRIEDWPLDQFRAVVDVNLSHTFGVCQVFGGEMVRRKRGSIVNIGSLYASVSPDRSFYDHISADPPFLKPPAYGASKAGLVNLTRYLATHWAPHGVRVNALSPGGVAGGQDAEFRRKFCARVPMGRMAETDDLVGPLLFLASDASRYVTGIELRVDGGFTAW
ncbi:MAG TPA: SDR family oxidoreductase [Gemmatimonadales bacterium]|nr:SDR family oxidoreductase [Gemmatimonadales bacterium]